MIDWGAIAVTLRLAAVTTVCLFVIGTPIAWWLTSTRSRLRPVVEAITALPLVLPPTVLGFYLLIALNPEAPIGGFWRSLTGGQLTFSFEGLVVASVLYSLPFMVQPLRTAFAGVPVRQREVAATLGAGPLAQFSRVVIPQSVRGFVVAGVLTFAHTIGEFGVVLMVGGNIPGETRVVSIAVYEQVETLAYRDAHLLSAILIVFSLIVLIAVYATERRYAVRIG